MTSDKFLEFFHKANPGYLVTLVDMRPNAPYRVGLASGHKLRSFGDAFNVQRDDRNRAQVRRLRLDYDRMAKARAMDMIPVSELEI